jgi:hypothetical protein
MRAAHYAQLQAVSRRAGVQGHVERVSIERNGAGWRVWVDARYDDGGRYRYRADYNGDAIKPSAVAFIERDEES